jgi:fido (protein-threonine AMPylation protein)
MTLAPGYGETPVPDDELAWLLPDIRDLLGEPVTKAAIYDLEQALQAQTTEQLTSRVLAGSLPLDELLSDHFVRELHKKIYGDVWAWAGRFRKLELNIGVSPSQIAMDLRNSLDTIRWRWEQTDDWSPRVLGIAVHADTVRIHPFTDGNGRTTRLLADLVFIAAQAGEELEQYDWNIDKRRYIGLLREYDAHRNPQGLAEFVEVQPFGA